MNQQPIKKIYSKGRFSFFQNIFSLKLFSTSFDLRKKKLKKNENSIQSGKFFHIQIFIGEKKKENMKNVFDFTCILRHSGFSIDDRNFFRESLESLFLNRSLSFIFSGYLLLHSNPPHTQL
jgi:hypothetical protein